MRASVLVSLLVSLLTLSPVLADDNWRSITSKEGQFTVEFPGKPTINQTRVRKGAGGTVKTILIGCKTDDGLYIAHKVILPTAIPKGTEDAELDAERNDFAKEWKGKVIAEKKIRAGDKIGRDFTIRGKPDEGEGVLNLRVREYLYDNSVFIIAVISPVDRELPEDTGHFLGSLALGEGKVRAQGTPSVEPKGVALGSWGQSIDPDGDCKMSDEMKKLTVTVPGTRHDLAGGNGRMNAPRVMREVEGDFVITVKIVGEFHPGGKSTNPKGVPFNGAGILIWSDIDNFIRFERAAVARGPKINTYVNFEEFEGGTRGASHNEVMKGGDCWVRVERKGSKLLGSISFDATTWKPLKPIQTVWPAKLKVGLTLVNSSNQPFTATFEDFEFKAGSK